MPDPDPTPENQINSQHELKQIIASLFAANGIAMEDVMNANEVLYMDPRSRPESEWVDASSVPIPEHVQRYLDSHDEITIDETNAIEVALEKYFQIPENWFISLDSLCIENQKLKKPLRFLLLKEPA